jgi:hypothetical protein
MTNINQQMRVLREDALLNRNNIWKNSFFEYLTFLSSDERGRCGEAMLTMLLRTLTSLDVEWNADTNISHADGSIYDLLVNKFRVEVKAATVGYSQKLKKQTNSYQHENIYEAPIWDKLALLDIAPDGYYLTVINHTDMVFGDTRHTILGTKATKHLSAWKFDTRKNTLARGIAGGITVYIAVDTDGVVSDEDQQKLTTFLNKHFGQ